MEERPSRDDTSLNSQNDDYEATNAIEADGVLDDKLLDAVTPRISVLDESVEEEDVHPVKRTFCTRCRTISSSFLSTSYVSGSDNLSGIERLQHARNSQTRFVGDLGHPATAGDSLEDSDDVPLLRVSHFGVRRTRTLCRVFKANILPRSLPPYIFFKVYAEGIVTLGRLRYWIRHVGHL